MKKIILIFIVLICGCKDSPIATIEWIKNHKHPIVCRASSLSLVGGGVSYTLIASDGQIYTTPLIDINLPDTLK